MKFISSQQHKNNTILLSILELTHKKSNQKQSWILVNNNKFVFTCIFSLSKLAKELTDVIELPGELLPESSSPGGLSILGLLTDFLLTFRDTVLKTNHDLNNLFQTNVLRTINM